MRWFVETHPAVDREIEELPEDVQARLVVLMETMASEGPRSRRLDTQRFEKSGDLWQLSAKVRNEYARALYVTVKGAKVIVLHVFIKSSHKTDGQDVALAKTRLKELKL